MKRRRPLMSPSSVSMASSSPMSALSSGKCDLSPSKCDVTKISGVATDWRGGRVKLFTLRRPSKMRRVIRIHGYSCRLRLGGGSDKISWGILAGEVRLKSPVYAEKANSYGRRMDRGTDWEFSMGSNIYKVNLGLICGENLSRFLPASSCVVADRKELIWVNVTLIFIIIGNGYYK